MKRLAVLLLWTLSACATGPSLVSSPEDRLWSAYQALDGDSKAVFLAYYPLLAPAERERVLGLGDLMANEPAKWPLEEKSLKKVTEFPFSIDRRRSYTLTGISIEKRPRKSDQEEPRDPFAIPLQATVHYADHRSADVTWDAHWKVPPGQGSMRNSAFVPGCIDESVVVTASFLDEAQGSVTVRGVRPIQRLELRVDEATDARKPEAILLKAKTLCEDGTSTDVSCKADWSVDPRDGKVTGCGVYRPSPEARRDGRTVRIKASYASRVAELMVPNPP